MNFGSRQWVFHDDVPPMAAKLIWHTDNATSSPRTLIESLILNEKITTPGRYITIEQANSEGAPKTPRVHVLEVVPGGLVVVKGVLRN